MKVRNDQDLASHHVRGSSPAEIPPQQNRKHLTEPSWIENMIYFTGVYLGQEAAVADESEDTGDENPPKTKAA